MTISKTSCRIAGLLGLCLILGSALAAPAMAQNYHDHGPGYGGGYHWDHDRWERERWRRERWEERHRYYPPPVVVAPPPRIIYAPPPVVYAPPPGITVVIPMTIR